MKSADHCPSGSTSWLLYSQNPPEISGHQSRFAEKDGVLLCETLLPEKANLKAMGISGGTQKTDRTGLRVDTEKVSGKTRFLNVIFVGDPGTQPPQINSKFSENGGQLELVISSREAGIRAQPCPQSRKARERSPFPGTMAVFCLNADHSPPDCCHTARRE